VQEGCKIKLKMGQEGEEAAQTEGEAKEQPKEEIVAPENNEEPEKKKEDVDKLRKVIKIDDKKPEKKEEKPSQDAELEPTSREGLEQKRAILQSIKDFDFQIKKNQEEITALNNKLDGVSKDLDDLVSLYEIVSEQMNPFVGLSKVTKKRLDALENFTKEIEDLKDRLGDIESFAVRAGADLNTMRENKNNDKIAKTEIKQESSEEIPLDENVTTINEEQTGEKELKVEETVQPKNIVEPTPIQESQTVTIPVNNNIAYPENSFAQTNNNNLNEDYIDVILEKSLNALSLDYKIDRVLDEFIESLKA
jgi:archaeal flagellar protein FlaC